MDEYGPVERLNYFNGQFLREPDFTAEQAYHLGRRWLHNRLLHTWGIAEGLTLSFNPGASTVTIRKGVAIDEMGREIVLSADTDTENLAGSAGQTVYLTLAYAESETDPTDETGVMGNTRITEAPTIGVDVNPPSEPGQTLILGRAAIDSSGEVSGTDNGEGANVRRTAGIVTADLEVNNLTLAAPGLTSTRLFLGADNRADVDHSLRVGGDLTVAGTLNATINHSALTQDDGSNPHNTTAADIDTQGGTNQLVAQINAGTGLIDKKNIGPGAGARGWVRLPFSPRRYGSETEFNNESETRVVSGTSGAYGVMSIPIPPGATRILNFRIAGESNVAGITINLFKGGWNLATNTPVSTGLLSGQIISGSPGSFNELFSISSSNQALNAESHTLGLRVQATGISRINLIAVEFE